MAEDKDLLKKDLALIIKLNSKLHYDDIAEVKKIYQAFASKNMFATSIGQRYLKKLESIIQGKNTATCIFCGKQCDSKSVICLECLEKLQPSTKQIVQPVETSTTDDSITKEKTKISDDSHLPEKAIQTETKDKVKNITKIVAIVVATVILIAIGLDTVFAILMLVSLGIIIYNTIKRKPKRNAVIAFAVFFVLTGIFGMFEEDTNADNILLYLGTSQSEVFEDYNADNFYSEYNLLTNEGTAEGGKPYVTLTSSGNVCTVILDSGMNSSLNVAGVYIGDSLADIESAMKKVNAVYDSEYSMAGILETYTFKSDSYNIQVIFKLENGMVTRISCTTNDVK